MSRTGNPFLDRGENGRYAAAQAALVEEHDRQCRRAARVVADHATGVDDCAEILAMLGLDARGHGEADR